ncbi:hypothetical protein K525DRAFT_272000 [Schizophyllum commune Loenen D]|nr:hypothetical protein K525DRAFT_272000 [Schizophyllum commune Loenen D]
MATTKVLQIPEILGLVAESLAFWSYPTVLIDGKLKPVWAALRPLVLVSRLWYQVVTPVLWRHIPSKAIWHRILAWSHSNGTNGREVASTSDHALDQDQKSFIINRSRYVRVVYHHATEDLSDEALTIASLLTPATLFPALKGIYYTASAQNRPNDDARIFPLFLAPTLLEIHLSAANKFLPDVTHIVGCCPLLENIHLRSGFPIDKDGLQALEAALCGAKNISRISLALWPEAGVYMGDYMQSLLRRPSIETYILSCPPCFAPPHLTHAAERILALVDFPDADSTARLLQSLGDAPRPFEVLYLRLGRPFTDAIGMYHLQELCDSSAERTQRATLTTLHLECTDSLPGFLYPAAKLHINHLRPFSEHPHLVSVFVHVSSGTEIDDDAIAELATWWPCLEELDIRGHRDTAKPCTHRALMAMALHCPKLQALTLPLELIGVPKLKHFYTTGQARCALRYLAAGRGRAPDPMAVAKFLVEIFPMLEKVSFRAELTRGEYGSGKSVAESEWIEVAGVLATGAQWGTS